MKIFLVDDHPVVIEGYKAMMNAEGISVVGSSTNGYGLIDWLDNNYCDVLLLDISMPFYNGFDVLKHLQKNNSPVKTIMVTSYCDSASISTSIDLGAKGYVLKEESAYAIVDAVKAVYNGKTYFSDLARDTIINTKLDNPDQLLITDMLSKKETEVLKFLVEGFESDVICEKMQIKPTTFRSYTERLRKSLGVKTNIQLVIMAMKHKTELFLKK
ncbi:response regulator transcription factor [Tenacibaculum ovolyticum]|uniref:response regulator transcription factor n=1 Tax=Tenacibaculum ovolyticum TaxID=104270 RepID=UPI0007ED98AD|nr:response regulator transcription factor [Tenacibaculum ovolyticum]WBX75800.1 response regulator transcription factor [Tenacibaculum ovolyticum]